ncbi:SMG7 [Lepeophtheirus salmonis]|uniref:SMG7 n=2 Tax=Lepeophtheirus salmonis TaxID=72036 RepID=A0A7R8GYS9_LEPSM|nr:SMG7 [Lepeophtheirus salmonis]CAF2753111.1 SMG7 [Lepeophtheirus salmonis]
MAAEVGKLNEAALSRKRKLEELRSKRKGRTGVEGEEEVNSTHLFRSYKPGEGSVFQDRVLDEKVPNEVAEHIEDELSKESEGVVLDSLDFSNLAPRKPDWDLKRDIAPKLDKLERRTQIAIAELIRERLAKEDLANAVAVGAAAAERESPESLKAFLSNNKNKNLSSDGTLWSALQDLQITLKQILLTDLTYALDKKVDVDLWNYGFKDYICYLQGQKEEMQMSSGFYLMLLEELRSTYDLDYPFLGRAVFFGYVEKPENDKVSFNTDPVVHRNNCNYISQHCLVHLGDLARYRNQIRKAETYYRQAIQISPSSGQAYNQIALLEANRGNKLASVFLLCRFLNNPPSKIINASTFTHSFLRLEASLRHSFKLKSAATLRQECNDSLTSLIATESLQTWELIQILTISLYQLESQDFTDKNVEDSLSLEENQIRQIACEFVASLLNSILLPVYTTKQGGDLLLEYFGLPCVKILLEWILIHPYILNQKRFLMKKQIWPTFCTLLNQLKQIDSVSNFESQEDVSLPEDFDLQGFLPLLKVSSKPSYSRNSGYCNMFFESDKSDINDKLLLLSRAKRLIDIGIAFAAADFPIKRIIYDGEIFEIVDYEAQYDDEDDILTHIEEEEINEEDEEETIEFVCDDKEQISSGILKMSKPEDRLITPPKKATNVRVNSILKNIADRDNKQVTFRTPSPATTLGGSQGSLSQNENNVLFFVPPPAINVPPPNFVKPPLHHNNNTLSLFVGGVPNSNDSLRLQAHQQPYNIGGTYSLFSGPNLLGQNFSTPPERQPNYLFHQDQGKMAPQSTMEKLFGQGNNFAERPINPISKMPSEEGTKLFVYGVRDTCPRSVLEDEFSKIGPVADVHITEKGYAFVTMMNPEDAEGAMRKLNGTTVHGQEVKVEIAHGGGRRGSSRGGGYRGRYAGGSYRGRFGGGGGGGGGGNRYHDNNGGTERRSYGGGGGAGYSRSGGDRGGEWGGY